MRILAKLTSELYQQQLISVNDGLEEERPFTDNGRRPVTLLQDNARPHKAKKILETIADLGWEILPHATYFPNLVPSDLFQSTTPPQRASI